MKTLNKSERQDFLKTEGKINSKLIRKKNTVWLGFETVKWTTYPGIRNVIHDPQ